MSLLASLGKVIQDGKGFEQDFLYNIRGLARHFLLCIHWHRCAMGSEERVELRLCRENPFPIQG